MTDRKLPIQTGDRAVDGHQARRPYAAPRLVALGSVKDLTGAGSGGSSDGGMPMA
jgi:hypothetical protein